MIQERNMTHKEIYVLIKALIKTSTEVEGVFRCAAQTVHSSELAVIITCIGDNCQQRASELQNHLVQWGGHTTSGIDRWDAVHRAWLSVRSMFCLNVDLEMMRDCKYREDQAIAQYRRALDQPLPGPLHVLLKRQYLGAKCNSVRLTDLIILEQSIAPKCYRQTTLTAAGHSGAGR